MKYVCFLIGILFCDGAIQVATGVELENPSQDYLMPTIYQLDNGMRVILNSDDSANSIDYRVVIGVGMGDYNCLDSQVPHILEHVMFAGTADRGAADLTAEIGRYGGDLNASTRLENTVYSLSVSRFYAREALGLIHDMLTRTEISEANFLHAKSIVAQELVSMPVNPIARQLSNWGVHRSTVQRAYQYLLPGDPIACLEFDALSHITRQQIQDAYDRYYVASNTTLIVVGGFDEVQMRVFVDETFGQMPTQDAIERISPSEWPTVESRVFRDRLSDVSAVDFLWRLPDRNHPDVMLLRLLSKHLNRELFNVIRLDNSLSYSPRVNVSFNERYGLMHMRAHVLPGDTGQLREVMTGFIANQIEQGISEQSLEDIVHSILMRELSMNWDSSSLADFYYRNVSDVQRHGKFQDYYQSVSSITPAEINQVMQKYLSPEKMIVLHRTQLFGPKTKSFFYYLFIVCLIYLVADAIYRFVRKWRRV